MAKKAAAHMSLKDFRQRLASYDDDYLLCKDMRHRWTLTQGYERQPNGWVTGSWSASAAARFARTTTRSSTTSGSLALGRPTATPRASRCEVCRRLRT